MDSCCILKRVRTREIAQERGAVVRVESRQGKGNVMRRMLQDVEAQVYIVVDGDDTYDPAIAPKMVRMVVEEHLAMVVARRIHVETAAYRPGHVSGNLMFTRAVDLLFGSAFTDIFSGYRAFSAAFVKSFPTASQGFEIETELSVHALTLRLPVGEIDTSYRPRPTGSESKLNTYRDGWRILWMVFKLFRTELPKMFYSIFGWIFTLLALILAAPIFVTFYQTGLVPRIPTALLSTGLILSAMLSFVCGHILDNVTQGRREAKLLAYLAAR